MTTSSASKGVDSESAMVLDEAVAAMDPEGLWPADLRQRRAVMDALMASGLATLDPERRIVFEHRVAPRPDGGGVPVRVYRFADGGDGLRPGILSIHGGGFTTGSLETDRVSATELVLATGAVVVSVGYRLAPEHPDPAAVEDCYAALRFLVDEADALGVDVKRLATIGVSARGGLSAGVALLARDRGGPGLVLQALGYPMLDDRCETASMRDLPRFGIWDRDDNVEGWTHLLGDRRGGPEVSPYAAPARASDLTGLAPTRRPRRARREREQRAPDGGRAGEAEFSDLMGAE